MAGLSTSDFNRRPLAASSAGGMDADMSFQIPVNFGSDMLTATDWNASAVGWGDDDEDMPAPSTLKGAAAYAVSAAMSPTPRSRSKTPTDGHNRSRSRTPGSPTGLRNPIPMPKTVAGSRLPKPAQSMIKPPGTVARAPPRSGIPMPKSTVRKQTDPRLTQEQSQNSINLSRFNGTPLNGTAVPDGFDSSDEDDQASPSRDGRGRSRLPAPQSRLRQPGASSSRPPVAHSRTASGSTTVPTTAATPGTLKRSGSSQSVASASQIPSRPPSRLEQAKPVARPVPAEPMWPTSSDVDNDETLDGPALLAALESERLKLRAELERQRSQYQPVTSAPVQSQIPAPAVAKPAPASRLSATPRTVVRELSPEPVVDQPTPRAAPPVAEELTPRSAPPPQSIQEARRASVQPMTTESDISGNDEAPPPPPSARRKTRSSVAPATPVVVAEATPVADRRQSRVPVHSQQAHRRQSSVTTETQPASVHRRQSSVSTEPQRHQSITPTGAEFQPESVHRRASISQVQTIDFSKPPASVRRSSRVLQQSPVRVEPSPKPAPQQRPRRSTMRATRLPIEPTPPPAESEEDQVMDEQPTPVASRKSVSPRKSLARGRSISPRKSVATRRSSVVPPTPTHIEEEPQMEHAMGRSTPRFQAGRVPIVAEADEDEDDAEMFEQPSTAAYRTRQSIASRQSSTHRQEHNQERDVEDERMEDVQHDEPEPQPVLSQHQSIAVPRKMSFKASRVPIEHEEVEPAPSHAHETYYPEEPAPSRRVSAVSRNSSTTSAASSHRSVTDRNTLANTSTSTRGVERLREPSFGPGDMIPGSFVEETMPGSFTDERDSQSRTVPSPVLPSARVSVRRSVAPAHRSTSPQFDATEEVPSLPSLPYDASRSALASVAQDNSGAVVSRRGSVAPSAPSRRASAAAPPSRRPSNAGAQSSFSLPVASSTARADAQALEDDDEEEPSFSFAQYSRPAARTNANKSINNANISSRMDNQDFSSRSIHEDLSGSFGPPAATSTLRKERHQHRSLAAVFAEDEDDASRSFAFMEADVSTRAPHQERSMRFDQSMRASQSMLGDQSMRSTRADESRRVEQADLSVRSHKPDSSMRRTEADHSMRSRKAADRSIAIEVDQSMRSHKAADQSLRSNRAADRSYTTDADISVRTARGVDQSMRTTNAADQSMRSKAAHESFATHADLSMVSHKAADRSARGRSGDRSYAMEADLSVQSNKAAEQSMRSNRSRANERSRSVEPSRMQLNDDDEDVSYDYAEEEQHLQHLDVPEPEQHKSFAAEASRADRSWAAPATERHPASFDDDEPADQSLSRAYSQLSPEPVFAPMPAPAHAPAEPVPARRSQRSPLPPHQQQRRPSPARPQRTSDQAVDAQPRRSAGAEVSPPRGRRLTRDQPAPDSARSRSRAIYQAVQESRVDDMFARRVRDGNKQRGLDLSSHSTRGRSNYSGGHASFGASDRSASRGPVSMDDYIGRTRSRAGSVSRPTSRAETYSKPVSRAGSIEPTRGRAPVTGPADSWRSASLGSAAPRVADTNYRPASRAESRERPLSRSGGYAAPTAASIRRATSAPPDDLPLANSRSRSVSREPSRSRPPVSGMPAASKKVRYDPPSSKTVPLSERDLNKTGGSRLTQATAASKGKANQRTASGSKVKPQPTTTVEKPSAAATKPEKAAGGRLTQPTKASFNKVTDPAKAVSARTAPKGILKAKPASKARPSLPPSHFRRSIEAANAQPSGSGARKFLRAAVAEADEAAAETKNGEGLGDVIAKYGEKLLGAAGLTWIKPTEPEPQAGPSVLRRATRKSAPSPGPSREQASEEDGDDDDSESEHDPHRELTLADLSPRKRRDAGMFVALSSPPPTSPMHPSSKRGSDTSPERPQESFKRARPNPPASPIPASSSPPHMPIALPISRPVSRAGTSHSGSQRSRARSQSRERSVSRTRSDKQEYEWEMPGYRNKQRVLEKLEQDRMRKELEAQARKDRPEMFVPEYLPPPPVVQRHVQPTVPHPFSFVSDTRGASRQRPEDFELRRQVFEQREQRAGSAQPTGSSRPSSRAAIIPDFAAIHASTAATLAAKRPKINPTVAHSPALNTASRARDRDRYDIGAREREIRLADLRRRQREERELEEEREYREARRRAVPKAHAVPDWYADAPKRAGEVRQRDAS